MALAAVSFKEVKVYPLYDVAPIWRVCVFNLFCSVVLGVGLFQQLYSKW